MSEWLYYLRLRLRCWLRTGALARRPFWARVQAGVGVYNVFSLLLNLDRGTYWLALVSFVCVIVTLHWRIDRFPP